MTKLSGDARAKLNLTLDVLGKRPDGYHDLLMVMQEISLGDTITLILGTERPWEMTCSDESLPRDQSNLAWKAAALFFEKTGIQSGGLSIHLEKQTPACAGMGGGSADAAAVLRLLGAHFGLPAAELFSLAEAAGADVPFTLLGKTALAEGKGEILTPLPSLPACDLVLCKPPFPISTPVLFAAIDREPMGPRPDTRGMIRALETEDLEQVAFRLRNVFTPLVVRDHPEIGEIRSCMRDFGALGTEMTGSGPTVFGIFRRNGAAEDCFRCLRARYPDTFLAFPV